MSWSTLSLTPLIVISFIRAAFTLYLFAGTQHGQINARTFGFTSGTVGEYTLLMFHWVPVNLMIAKADLFSLYFGSLNKILACGAGDVIAQDNSLTTAHNLWLYKCYTGSIKKYFTIRGVCTTY
jgi:hypothetical protein